MTTPLETARTILRSTFGYDDFRSGQREIIDAVLHGRDVLGVMPTGGGKSLCFQIPALALPPCTLVISPLVALMTDQVARLNERGVAAAAMHGGMSQGELNDVIYRAHQGLIRLLYVAPERLESKTFRAQIASIPIHLLAVDEAHCISEWGHDFRPAYRSISTLFEHRPRVPIIALTATATPEVREDIVRSLGLKSPVHIVRGFDRSNLTFRVETTPHKIEAITRYVHQHPDHSVLVYAGSRRRVDTIAAELQKRKISAAAYHAGKPPATRADVQDRFVRNDVRVLVATNAFGMGIDKPDVRAVFHADLTLTLEAYYQEAGRAGRDGQPAVCTLLYQSQDRGLMDFFVASTYPDTSLILTVLNALYDRARVGVGGTSTQAVQADAASLAADLHLPPAYVSGVLTLLERSGVLVSAGAHGKATLRMRTTTERLQEFVQHAPPERRAALEVLERLLMGAAQDRAVHFDPTTIFRRATITPVELADALQALHMARILTYVPAETDGGVVLLRPRPPRGVVPIDTEDLAKRRTHAVTKLMTMVRYAESSTCKRNFILQYFGDPEIHGTCGRCSACTGTSVVAAASVNEELLHSVIHTVHELAGRFGRHVVADVVTGTVSSRVIDYDLTTAVTWARAKRFSRGEVVHAIDEAVRMGLLVVSASDYPTLSVSASGARLASPLPRSRRFNKREMPSLHREAYAALTAWRQKVADIDDVIPSTILSHQALEALATDCPRTLAELVPGRHGSGRVLGRYGQDVIAVISSVSSEPRLGVPAVQMDAETERVIQAVRPTYTVIDVARSIKASPATVARCLQRGIELGVLIERGALVDDHVFTTVLQYLREHRYAKLRQVVEHIHDIGLGDVDVPTVRVAMALARRELYG